MRSVPIENYIGNQTHEVKMIMSNANMNELQKFKLYRSIISCNVFIPNSYEFKVSFPKSNDPISIFYVSKMSAHILVRNNYMLL